MMMASFLPVIVSKKNKQTKNNIVFFCSLSQIHINPEKHEKNTKMTSSDVPKVKVTLINLSLLSCMLFTKIYSHNFYQIVMKFGKHYFLVLQQLFRFNPEILLHVKWSNF